MFCGNCGTQIADGAGFCPNCGAPAESQPQEQSQPQVDPVPVKAGKFSNKFIGILAAVVAAVLVIVLCTTLFGGSSPEKVACQYMEAGLTMDYDTLKKTSALDVDKFLSDAIEALADESDMTVKEVYEELEEMLEEEDIDVTIRSNKDIFNALKKLLEEEWEDTYGKYKITVEPDGDPDKMKKKELKELIEEIEDTCDMLDLDVDDYIDTDKIKEAYIVEVECEIEGEDDEDSQTMEVTVVKYKGKWKVLDDPYSLVGSIY